MGAPGPPGVLGLIVSTKTTGDLASRGFNPLSLLNHAQIFFFLWQGSEQDDCYGGVWRERRLAGGLGGGGQTLLEQKGLGLGVAVSALVPR